jgi:hypothetical protein
MSGFKKGLSGFFEFEENIVGENSVRLYMRC